MKRKNADTPANMQSASASEKNIKKEKSKEPYHQGARPLLLCTACMLIILAAFITDRFIYSFGQGLLAPAIVEIIAIPLPCFMLILLSGSNGSRTFSRKSLGFKKLRAEYVFMLLFAALFMCCGSLVLSVICGGVYSSAEGFTLIGIFTAGESEYTVSTPYLILVYAVVPAVTEEIMFRGIIFKELSDIGIKLAATVSAILFALFSFSLGNFIPMLFCGLLLTFILHTTGSLISCIIVHFLFNLYRLFAEPNVSAYFLSSQNLILLITTILTATLISAALFFSEISRIYRAKAANVPSGKQNGHTSDISVRELFCDLERLVSFRPTAVCGIICLCIFAAVIFMNYFL